MLASRVMIEPRRTGDEHRAPVSLANICEREQHIHLPVVKPIIMVKALVALARPLARVDANCLARPAYTCEALVDEELPLRCVIMCDISGSRFSHSRADARHGAWHDDTRHAP
jgi:hypothetical protein